jgi:hypothetical protein
MINEGKEKGERGKGAAASGSLYEDWVNETKMRGFNILLWEKSSSLFMLLGWSLFSVTSW